MLENRAEDLPTWLWHSLQTVFNSWIHSSQNPPALHLYLSLSVHSAKKMNVRGSKLGMLWLVLIDCLIGLVVRRPPRERKVPGSNAACAGIFSGSSHTSDLKTGTPVATLPGAWRYRVSTGTGWPGVSILWLGEVESLICNFYLGVAARKIVWADPSLRYTSLLLER